MDFAVVSFFALKNSLLESVKIKIVDLTMRTINRLKQTYFEAHMIVNFHLVPNSAVSVDGKAVISLAKLDQSFGNFPSSVFTRVETRTHLVQNFDPRRSCVTLRSNEFTNC